MTTYFTTDPTARVSFWDNKVEHTVTGDGLTIAASLIAEGLVERGLLFAGEPDEKTTTAHVYDPEKDESIAYARQTHPEFAPPTAVADQVASVAAAAEAEALAAAEKAAAEKAAAEAAKTDQTSASTSGVTDTKGKRT